MQRLKRLRDEDALGNDQTGIGLQALLTQVHHPKHEVAARAEVLPRQQGRHGYENRPFEKLDDFHTELAESPLLPFEGADPLFYLELREVIEETIQEAREGTDHRTFITTDFGKDCHPIRRSRSRPLDRDLESAKRLKGLVESWNDERNPKLHPKVKALADIVEKIATQEIEKVRSRSDLVVLQGSRLQQAHQRNGTPPT